MATGGYAFNSSDYPRIYRYKRAYIVQSLLQTGVITLAVVGGLIYALFAYPGLVTAERAVLWLGCGGLTVGALLIGIFYGTFIRLKPGSIEVYTFFIRQALKRDEIIGCRPGPAFLGEKSVNLMPETGMKQPIQLYPEYAKKHMGADEAFESWYKTLPDYGEAIEQRQKELADKQRGWGNTSGSRYRTYRFLKSIDMSFFYVFAAICVVGADIPAAWFPALTPGIALSMYALPLVGIVLFLRAPDAYTYLYPAHEKVKINLSVFNEMTGAILMVWFYKSVVLSQAVLPDIYKKELWLENPLFLGLCSVFFLTALIDIKKVKSFSGRAVLVFTSAILIPLSAAGFMLSYDVLFDKSAPQIHETVIVKKSFDEDCDGLDFCWGFETEPWDSENAEDSENVRIAVTRDLYNSKQEGETVCVYIHPGAAGIPWERAGDCP